MKKLKLFLCLALCLSSAFFSMAQNVADTLDFVRMTAQTPASLIKGRVSGVSVTSQDGGVNSSLNTNIRGVNSLHADSQPLWIVDGVALTNGLRQNLNAFWQKGGFTTKGDAIPDYSELSYSSTTNSMSFLNPYDIESIEVVKDMSAAAKYGIQGANGVIVVKTRKAKSRERSLFAAANVGVDMANRTGGAFRPGVVDNYTASVRGFVNGTSYNVSAFFRNVNSVVRGSGNNTGGLRASLETKANSVVWFGMSGMLSASIMNNAAGVTYLGRPSTMIISRYPNRFAGDSVQGWLDDYDDDVEDYRALTSIYLQLNLAPSFHIRMDFGADFEGNNRRIWYGNGTSFGAKVKGAASIMNSTLLNYNGSISMCYNRYVARRHHVSIQACADLNGSRNRFGVMNGTTFDLPYLRARGLSSMSSRAVPYKFSRDYFIAGVYGQVAYDFDGYVGADVLYRADFSPKYSADKHIGYPAANAWVDIHKIAFPSLSVLSMLKLTGGYGMAGREEYVPYEILGNYLTYYPMVYNGTEVFYDGLNRVMSKEWNVGLEMAFVSDRLRLSAKYYDKSTRDIFSIYNFSKLAGIYYVWSAKPKVDFNADGTLANRGFEFDLSGDIIRGKSVKWSAYANCAYNLNRVQKVEYAQMAGIDIGKNIFVNIMAPGKSAGSLYGYKENSDGSLMDQNADGDITDADKVILGNTIPLVSGAFGTTLKLFGVTIDMQFTGAAGHKIANLNKVIAEGRNKLTSRYVQSADFLRLGRLSCGYDIPLKSNKVRNLNVSLSALNLLTFTSYGGWNPDVNCFGSSVLANGVDYGSYPTTRSIVLGVGVNF